MKRVKKILMEAAKKDREAIMNDGSYERLLALIAEHQKADKANSTKSDGKNKTKTMVCPDCGGTLLFKPQFGLFMHEDCEKANCWYQANELGECVDNNQKRANRITKFNSEI